MNVKACLVAAGSALLAGCDFTVPLAKAPEAPIDRALVGAWSRTDDAGRAERLLVLPLGPAEYLVSFPAEEKNALFARACFCQANTMKLVQLNWFGTARGTVPEDGRVYQYAVYTLKGDTLQIGLLNADVVARDASTPEALVKAIEAGRENPNLFREAMTFKREPPPADPNAAFKRPPVPAGWQ